MNIEDATGHLRPTECDFPYLGVAEQERAWDTGDLSLSSECY